MATMVGTQADFGKVLKELAELDYDAVEAYRVALERLENEDYKKNLSMFLRDHEDHVERINEVLEQKGRDKVTGPSGKQYLTKGKVAIADMLGDDNTILKAMLSNEEDTNVAYGRVNSREDIWQEAVDIIKKGAEDEKRHKTWIENTLSNL